MNSQLFQPNVLPEVIKAIAPIPKTVDVDGSLNLMYSLQVESQILLDVDYKIFCVDSTSNESDPHSTGNAQTTSFIVMTKRGMTSEDDIDVLLLCNGRIFNPGHWMNDVLLSLSQAFIDIKSTECLSQYDVIAKQIGLPEGNLISVMPGDIVNSLENLSIDVDNISRLNYIDEHIEITL